MESDQYELLLPAEKENAIFSVVKEDNDGKLQTGIIPNLNDNALIFTVGFCGAQKMGKSTIANLLYGTKFHVEENLDVRTTEGINGCFVQKNESFNTEDIIVLDCEGEKSQQKKSAIKEKVFALPKLTDREKEEKAESLLKVSDLRYASFLWCTSNCIVVILPNNPPNNDTIHFFELIHQSMERLQKINHRPSLILVIRTSNSHLKQLIPAYKKVFDNLKGFYTLISDLSMLNLPRFDDTPEEYEFQDALTAIKEKINEQLTKHEQCIQASWAECLKRIAFNLNNDANLEDLNFLKVQIELNFILSHNEGKIFELAECLENLISCREAINKNFDNSLFEEYKNQVSCLIQTISQETEKYKKVKTAKSLGAGACAVLAFSVPPAAILGIAYGVLGLAIDSKYNKGIQETTDAFLQKSQAASDKLNNIYETIQKYQQSFKEATAALVVHETILSRVEFFYAIARGVLKGRNPQASPEEFVRYMFILFNENLNIDHNGTVQTDFNGQRHLGSEKASSTISASLAMGSHLGILLRKSSKLIAAESGYAFSTFGKSILRTIKYGGVALSAVVEVFDLFSTWQTDQSKLISNMTESQERLGGFHERLSEFWKANGELLNKIHDIVKEFEQSQVS